MELHAAESAAVADDLFNPNVTGGLNTTDYAINQVRMATRPFYSSRWSLPYLLRFAMID